MRYLAAFLLSVVATFISLQMPALIGTVITSEKVITQQETETEYTAAINSLLSKKKLTQTEMSELERLTRLNTEILIERLVSEGGDEIVYPDINNDLRVPSLPWVVLVWVIFMSLVTNNYGAYLLATVVPILTYALDMFTGMEIALILTIIVVTLFVKKIIEAHRKMSERGR